MFVGRSGVRCGTDNSVLLLDYIFHTLIPADVLNVLFAILVVWAMVCLKLDSVLLGSLGIIHIIFSFVVGYFFWTQMLLGLGDQMPIIAALVPFLVLGIGADDLFIFMDAWRQSEEIYPRSKFVTSAAPSATSSREPHESVTSSRESHAPGDRAWRIARLTYAYRRSSWAMLITSLTTGVAFIQLVTSSILGRSISNSKP